MMIHLMASILTATLSLMCTGGRLDSTPTGPDKLEAGKPAPLPPYERLRGG
jgi:hypothetical protein